MSKGFCHLNLHTDRSQYVGMIKPREIVDWSKRHGLSAVAITDHDNMCAAVQLYQHCKSLNLKPIYGMEVSVCSDKTKRERGTMNLVLLAQNYQGFKNLIILATLSGMYFYYRPRIDWSDLRKYGDGLIALTACLNGIVAKSFFVTGKINTGYADLVEIFGDNLYLEIQPTLKEAQRIYNEACVKYADEHTDVKLVVTGDPHYLNNDDAEFHEHLMRIKVIGSKDGEWSYPFRGPYHVRTYDEMVEQFADLHGYDVTAMSAYRRALDAPNEIIDLIDRFDIKEGVRIPSLV